MLFLTAVDLHREEILQGNTYNIILRRWVQALSCLSALSDTLLHFSRFLLSTVYGCKHECEKLCIFKHDKLLLVYAYNKLSCHIKLYLFVNFVFITLHIDKRYLCGRSQLMLCNSTPEGRNLDFVSTDPIRILIKH